MTKITLNDLSNLNQEFTAVNTINANNAVIEAASDNNLSRDGTSPNSMLANLDMNGFKILNLPTPINPTDVVRLQDIPAGGGGGGGGGGGSGTVGSGTSGQVAVYPGAGTTVSGSSSLSGITISGAANTLTNIGNSSLTNSTMNIAGHAVALGGTQALAASDLTNGTTGSGNVVLATSPSLVTPALGTATATTINKVTVTQPASGSTLTIANGATLSAPSTATVSGTNTGDQTITLTGDVTGGGTGSFAATIANNAVTNAKAAQMAAYTIKGNATGSTANATDISIPALTQKVSPVAGDFVMIADSAASNALKYATVGTIAAGGSVSSIAGNTGAFTLTGGITNSTNAIQVDGSFSYRNRLLNPTGVMQQAGVGSVGDGAYSGFDQWVSLNQTNPVTTSALTAVENGMPFAMRTTQSQAVAQRFGLIQWLENVACADLRGQALVLSARVRCSASTTLRYAIIEWTGTADAITKDIVLDWTSPTFTTGNFFTTTSTTVTSTGSIALTANTLTNITPLTGTPSGSMNNLAVFFWTDSTQAQNVTLDIGKVQLEQGLAATTFAMRPYAEELMLCQRFYQKVGFAMEFPVSSGSDYGISANFMCQMRGTPSLSANDSATTSLGAPVNLSALTSTSYEYRKRASATGAGALISVITCDSRL